MRNKREGATELVIMKVRIVFYFCLIAACLHAPSVARAQAGPPFLTNDPGTPGNANWEINVAEMQTNTRGASSYQIPQIDLNFGVGDRIQLSYEIPYVLQTNNGQRTVTGWGNGFVGVKWRFLDQGEGGWQISTFPQLELSASLRARENGIAGPGPRYLLPIEVERKVGPLDLDFEVGYYPPGNGLGERILGIVAGYQTTERLELGAELYDDRVSGGTPRSSTSGLGGRYKFRPGLIALFMAGRSINGVSAGQLNFVGYFGVQILLTDYGRSWNSE